MIITFIILYIYFNDFCNIRSSLSWLELIETLYSDINKYRDITSDLRKKHK